MFKVVKTWCESTKEGENYLKYNGYGKWIKRLFNTNYYLCIGSTDLKECRDIEIIQ